MPSPILKALRHPPPHAASEALLSPTSQLFCSPNKAPSAPRHPPLGSLRSVRAISQTPWDSRIHPDISTELRMGSVLHVFSPTPKLPRLLSIPNCLESLGFPFPWKPDPPRPHTDSAGLEGSLRGQSLTLASPFPGTSRPIHGGKGPSSAPGEGPGGRRLQAGMGVCKGKQGLGRKASSPGLRGNRKEGWA